MVFSHRERHLEPEVFKAKYFRSVKVVEHGFTRYQWPLYAVFSTLVMIGFVIWYQLDLSILKRVPVGIELLIHMFVITALAAASAWIASRPKFDDQAYDFRDEKLSKHLVRCYKYRAQHGDIWAHYSVWKYNGACRREYEFVMGFDIEDGYDEPPEWITS